MFYNLPVEPCGNATVVESAARSKRVNKQQNHRCVLLFITILCLLTAAAYGQQPVKKGKKEFVFKGKVEGVDLNKKTVVVNNDGIPGVMLSVTATYSVDNPEVLKTLVPGDHVTAKIYEGNFKVLYELRPVPPEDTPLFPARRKK